MALSQNLKETKTLIKFHLIDMKISNACWLSLGQALGKNKSCRSVRISVSNLNEKRNMEDFMNGVQHSDVLQKLSLTDSELNDEHGLFILNLIKFQAEKRDRTQWLEGLRQPKAQENLFDQLKFKDVNFKSIDHKVISPTRSKINQS